MDGITDMSLVVLLKYGAQLKVAEVSNCQDLLLCISKKTVGMQPLRKWNTVFRVLVFRRQDSMVFCCSSVVVQ